MNTDLLLENETYAIIGAAMEVSSELGCGFLEAIYQEALSVELANRAIPHVQQHRLKVTYKNRPLKKAYVADFICYDLIVVEIKCLRRITSIEEAQLLNYLKAAKLPVGLILNFGKPRLEWKRFVRTAPG
jgi:GxxExxY protein